MSRLFMLLLGAAAGAAAAHLFDRESGAKRRNQLRDKASSTARAGKEKATSAAGRASGKAKGAAATATGSMPVGSDRIEDVDDVTLARKVESEIFRDADAPKGQVSVDVQNGIANLRGEVADEGWIAKLADEAKKVDGVKGVNNLLHGPGTPAPSPGPQGTAGERS
jgi:osmotically-inducible protein OsmY